MGEEVIGGIRRANTVERAHVITAASSLLPH